jgi:hypothetical protein
VLGLAERFGSAPHEVLTWDASILRLLRIEALGREDDQHGGQQ